MAEVDAFLAEISDRPDDDGPRLLYAYWLEENLGTAEHPGPGWPRQPTASPPAASFTLSKNPAVIAERLAVDGANKETGEPAPSATNYDDHQREKYYTNHPIYAESLQKELEQRQGNAPVAYANPVGAD